MPKHTELAEALSLIFRGIEQLKTAFPARRFTIDGRLVGDIGEVIAALRYDIQLDDISRPGYDGVTSDGRRVQVKATFQDKLTFSTIPDYYLGFRLFKDGSYEEVYNGPGEPIYAAFAHRQGIGRTLLRFPAVKLKVLSALVAPHQRIALREDVT